MRDRIGTVCGAERLKQLARQYAATKVDLSWSGGTDPEDHEQIRQRYRDARRKLYDAIDALVLKWEGPTCG